jgi:hypothetical protein
VAFGCILLELFHGCIWYYRWVYKELRLLRCSGYCWFVSEPCFAFFPVCCCLRYCSVKQFIAHHSVLLDITSALPGCRIIITSHYANNGLHKMLVLSPPRTISVLPAVMQRSDSPSNTVKFLSASCPTRRARARVHDGRSFRTPAGRSTITRTRGLMMAVPSYVTR